jgi:molybdenum cofactor cytidylyltransferase
MVEPVAGLVLAAGASTRMGLNKLLLELEGTSLLRRAASRALDARLEPVVVVLGYEAERARRELHGLDVQITLNSSYRLGLSGSLRAGITALPDHVAAAVVLLADMPFVTSHMLATLVDRFRRGSAPLVISEYDGAYAPPALYRRSLFRDLMGARGDSAGRETIRRHRAEADVVRWPAWAVRDIDTPEDYSQSVKDRGR